MEEISAQEWIGQEHTPYDMKIYDNLQNKNHMLSAKFIKMMMGWKNLCI